MQNAKEYKLCLIRYTAHRISLQTQNSHLTLRYKASKEKRVKYILSKCAFSIPACAITE